MTTITALAPSIPKTPLVEVNGHNHIVDASTFWRLRSTAVYLGEGRYALIAGGSADGDGQHSESVPSLDTLAGDPRRLKDLPLPLLIAARSVAAHLVVELDAQISRATVIPGASTREADTWLNPDQASAMFGVSKRWLLDNADTLPGCVRLGHRTVRFSQRALTRHLQKNKA